MLLPVKKILKLTMDEIKSNKKHQLLLSQKCNVTKNIGCLRRRNAMSQKILGFCDAEMQCHKKYWVFATQKCNVTKNIAFYREAKTIQKTISEAEINGTFFRSSYSHLPFKEQS
jgi:hypothetical protein